MAKRATRSSGKRPTSSCATPPRRGASAEAETKAALLKPSAPVAGPATSAAAPRLRDLVETNAHATAVKVRLADATLLADMSGALVWPERRTLIVADLHLEKGSAYAARGQLLPPYDTRETLDRLAEVLARYQPKTVIALGDSTHDTGASERMASADLSTLRTLQRGRDWIWIAGNHDPQIGAALSGQVVDRIAIAGITFVHAAEPDATGREISAHFHPVAKLVRHTQSVRRPCFIGDGQRMILPAFGALTGGLNVLDPAFAGLFAPERTEVWMLGRAAVYPLALHQLSAD